MMKKFGGKWLFLFSAMLMLMAAPAGAEDAQSGVFNLGEVVVTGESETITGVSTVETVDAEKIDLENARNINKALETLPGVYTNVGVRNESNINIRGFNERYVPVFYDGIPLYIPYDGYVDTGNLPTGNVSHVTLTKGISSVLYGANSMGGVINIVSRKPEKTFEADATLEWVEDSDLYANVNLGTRMDKWYAVFNGSVTDSPGFLMSDDFDPTAVEDGDRRENSDISDFSGALKVGFLPAEGHEYAIGYQRVDREKGLPPETSTNRPRYWRFTEWEKQTFYFIGDSKLTDNLTVKTRIFRDEYYNVLDSYDNATFTSQDMRYAFHSTYDDYSNGASVIVRTDFIPNNTLSGSIQYKQDVHTAQGDYGDVWEEYETRTWSFGLEDDWKISDRLALVVGVSYDINKPEYANGGTVRDDESAVNPQIGILGTVGEDWDLHFSVGMKTRFPTMNELYSEQLGRNIANPDLEEEEAINWEAGVKKPLPYDTLAGLTLFYSDVENLIVEREVGNGLEQQQNLGEARFMGFEVSLSTKMIERNQVSFHYTYLDAEDQSPARTSDNLEDQSKHKVYVSDLIEVFDWMSLYGKISYNSKRYYEDSDNDRWETLDGYWLMDLKAIVTYFPVVTLEAGVKNLFDENYEQSLGYPREGQTFFIGAKAVY